MNQTEGIRITHLKIEDFRGIQALDVNLPPAGAIVTGECRTGKTSVLNAVLAALTAQGVGPDAIRKGADESQVFVELGELTVRRRIEKDGSTLKATQAIPHSKQRAEIKQKRLDELFGRGISPMGLFRAKPDERRKIVMSAMPMRLEGRHLDAWLTDEQRASLPAAVVQAIPLAHGLEAVALLHKHFYDVRARANADVKAQKGKVDHAVAAWAKHSTAAVVPELEACAACDKAIDDAAEIRRKVDRALARAKEVSEFESRTQATRSKIAIKREEAERLRSTAFEEIDLGPLEAEGATVTDRIATLERQLEDARKELAKVAQRCREASAVNQARRRTLDAAAMTDRSADELEASLSVAALEAPTEQERAALAAQLVEAEARVGDARKVVAAAEAKADAAKEAEELARLEALAAGLTATVDHLRTTAPAELLSESEGIPGLGLEDGELTVDGVRLDGLSGAEQLRLCIDVAKRASLQRGGEGRVLITDGLEALDPKTLRGFIREATRDGWQLLATRVTEGDLTVQAIELETEAEAAQ